MPGGTAGWFMGATCGPLPPRDIAQNPWAALRRRPLAFRLFQALQEAGGLLPTEYSLRQNLGSQKDPGAALSHVKPPALAAGSFWRQLVNYTLHI